MTKISANDLSVGNTIIIDNELYVVTSTNHVKPGKGGAFIQAGLRNIKTHAKNPTRFRSSESVEKAIVEEKKYYFRYKLQDILYFTDEGNLEEKEIHQELIPDEVQPFLIADTPFFLSYYEDSFVAINFCGNITLTVTNCEPAIKAQTAASSYKPAVLENGLHVMVPPHITEGTRIEINPQDHSFIGKAHEPKQSIS